MEYTDLATKERDVMQIMKSTGLNRGQVNTLLTKPNATPQSVVAQAKSFKADFTQPTLSYNSGGNSYPQTGNQLAQLSSVNGAASSFNADAFSGLPATDLENRLGNTTKTSGFNRAAETSDALFSYFNADGSMKSGLDSTGVAGADLEFRMGQQKAKDDNFFREDGAFAGTMAGLNAGASLYGAYLGKKNYDLAKDTLSHQKRMDKTNMAMNKDAYKQDYAQYLAAVNSVKGAKDIQTDEQLAQQVDKRMQSINV